MSIGIITRMTPQEKEILYKICVSVAAALDALKYSQLNDRDESYLQNRKAERELEEAINLIKQLPED